MKDERKVVASTAEGVINIFSWDWFGDCNDRIVGHPGSIDTMIKYDEECIITGCEDGLIRAVSVLPNKIISILGDPLEVDEEVFHIQKICLSHDKKLLASCSLDNIVKIIDISELEKRFKDNDFNEEVYEASIQDKLKANHGKIENPEPKEGKEDEWESQDEYGDSDDDSDMSDSDDGKKKQ